jgi:hypothetical protein
VPKHKHAGHIHYLPIEQYKGVDMILSAFQIGRIERQLGDANKMEQAVLKRMYQSAPPETLVGIDGRQYMKLWSFTEAGKTFDVIVDSQGIASLHLNLS